MVGFCTTSHAIAGLGGAALLGAGLAEIGVDLAVSAGVGYIGYELLNSWLNSTYSIKGALTGIADGYIKVGDSSVTIDGVQYESIFLDPSMAAELHTQLFDFVTAEAITSNSSAILKQGKGFVAGEPVYYPSEYSGAASVAYTFNGLGTYNIGDVTIVVADNDDPTYKYKADVTYQGNTIQETSREQYMPFWGYVKANTKADGSLTDGGNGTVRINTQNPANYRTMTLTGAVHAEEFTYSYVAGNIDATPLPQDYGFQLYVPTGTLQQAGISAGTYVVGGVGEDVISDLIDLLDTLNPEEIQNAEFTDIVDPPVPPTPVPTDTPLSDVPYSQFIDTFGQSITDGLENVNDTIGLYGEDIIDTVDTVGQSITDELQNVEGVVDTVGQSIVDELESVETGIDTLGQTLTDALDNAIDNVLEAVDSIAITLDDIIEAIMTHPLDLFSNFLDRLANIPIIKNIFDGIKQHVRIWHYVVEWLTCVGTFLGFMIGVFSDTAYCMVVPIYACVAAAICLAFYKRFGR